LLCAVPVSEVMQPEPHVRSKAGPDRDRGGASPTGASADGVKHATHEGTGSGEDLCRKGQLADEALRMMTCDDVLATERLQQPSELEYSSLGAGQGLLDGVELDT
jgi:hypothetical protein